MMIQDLATQAIDYKAVFKQSPGVAYLMSPSFEILDVSDGAVGLTGRDRRDLIGRKFFDAFPANPRASEDSGRASFVLSWPGRCAQVIAPS